MEFAEKTTKKNLILILKDEIQEFKLLKSDLDNNIISDSVFLEKKEFIDSSMVNVLKELWDRKVNEVITRNEPENSIF